ncbi:MAG: DinB family protein [Dehalococcoidia bacterium]
MERPVESEPQSGPAIFERFRRAAAALYAAVAPLSDEQLLARPPDGGWAKRDILAHIAADHRWWAGQLAALAAARLPSPDECYAIPGPPPAGYDMATPDGRNAWQFEQHKSQPLPEIHNALLHYRARIIELAEMLPAGEFAAPYAIVESGYTGQVRPAQPGEQGFPLWQWFRGNTWHHYEDHLPDLQA